MLSPIDERQEEEGSVQRLDPASTPKCSTLSDIVGGHGPWQFRHWLVFFTASLCTSLHLFSVFPFSSAVDCSCGNTSVHGAEYIESVSSKFLVEEGNKACSSFYAIFQKTETDAMHCHNVGLTLNAKCIYLLGILLSGLTSRLLTFKFGRRITSLTSCLFLLATSVAIGWAQNAATFLILRFIISYTITNVYLLSISSLRECVGDEYILLYGLTGHIGWGLAHLILPLVVWLAGDWIFFSISASCIPFFLFVLLCFIPESVEAYLSKGLRSRAHKVIRKAAWLNGYPTQDLEHSSQSLHQQKEQEDMKIMCKKGNFKRYFELFLRFLIGFSASFLYFVSVSLTEWRRVERGAFFALASTTQVASALVLLFFTCFLSSKHLWSATTVLASGSFLLMYAKTSEGSPISTPPYLLTMFFSSVAFTLILVKTLFQPFATSSSKWNAIVTCVALCIGALLASLNDIQKFHGWNPKLLVIMGIPNLTIGTSIAVVPDRYFTL